jgi:hypothetical protein
VSATRVADGRGALLASPSRSLLAGLVRMATRPWRTARLPELVGFAEACEILGVQKMTLKRWMEPGSGSSLPGGGYGPDKTRMIPPQRIRSGPVWVREDVERFRDEVGRQRARAGAADAD